MAKDWMEALFPPRRDKRLKPGEKTKHQVGKPCGYCGEDMHAPTRDHVLPRSRGHSLRDNRVWCCGPCNRHKGNRTLPEWLEVLERKPKLHAIRIANVKRIIFLRRQMGLPTHLPPLAERTSSRPQCIGSQYAAMGGGPLRNSGDGIAGGPDHVSVPRIKNRAGAE